MHYKPMTAEQFTAYAKGLEKQHGRNAGEVAKRSEFVRMVTALFDESRPKGRRFQLFTTYEEPVKVQIWEDTNYARKLDGESWGGCELEIATKATPEEVEKAIIGCFKQADKWTLR